MLISFIVIGLVETYSFLTNAPLQEIIEDFICHNQYPDHMMNEPTIQDRRCKEPDVQKTLAMVKSWWSSAEMWVPALVQIPYGIIADKYGRRPVIFLSLFGVLLEGCIAIVILLHPQTFSIWGIVATSLTYFIGGGPPMATAMVWTILCDSIPAAERTKAFYRVSALGIILSAILNPIAAWLMGIDPWLPMWIGILCMLLGTFAALFIPETLRLRKAADASHHRRSSSASERLLPREEPASEAYLGPPKALVKELLLGAKQNFQHIWRFIFASKSVALLVAALGAAYPIRLAVEGFMLQYTTKRFDWSWSKATYVFTTTKATGLVMLLLVLPIGSKLVARKFGDNPIRRDLYLARISINSIALGCLFAAIAYTPPLIIVGFVFYGIGAGFVSQLRALVTGIVEPHTLATLNTMISSMETIMGSIGAPAFGWLMSRGMELGGAWLGLPYLATTGFAILSCILLWVFRIPHAFL